MALSVRSFQGWRFSPHNNAGSIAVVIDRDGGAEKNLVLSSRLQEKVWVASLDPLISCQIAAATPVFAVRLRQA
jgi:hypothetical protein